MSEAEDEALVRARARVGQVLAGKYRIERVLGMGGMGAVFAGVHRNGRRVAVKLLHPELAMRADIRARFIREGLAANAVRHPGVVAIIDDDVTDDGAQFLVMELLEGQSVEDLALKNGGVLPAKMVLAIGRELCDVLAAAHAAGIIHRDIKPANLFVTPDGRVKVLDFGLARLRDAALGMKATATGIVFGTPAFLPPEQAAGRVSQVDAISDVWAVGATLFTLLTGRTVHEGESGQHLVMLAATTPAPSLANVLPDAPPVLVDVIDRALTFDKADRWPSARAMHTALRAASTSLFGIPDPPLLEMSDLMEVTVTAVNTVDAGTPRRLVGTRTSEPVSSSPPTEAQRGKTPAKSLMTTAGWRKRASAAAVGGVAIALSLIGVGILASHSRAIPEPTTASPVPESPRTLAENVALPAVSAPDPIPQPSVFVVTPSESVTVAPRAQQLRPASRPVPNGSAIPKPSGCEEKFVVDSSGKKIWKPECL